MPTQKGPARWAGPFAYASLAQSVEHAAVNRRVVGSSPTGGAKSGLPPIMTASRSIQIRCYGHGPLAQLVRATGS